MPTGKKVGFLGGGDSGRDSAREVMQLDVFFLLLMLLLPLAEAVPLALTGCCSLCNMHLPLVVFMISVRTTTDKPENIKGLSLVVCT